MYKFKANCLFLIGFVLLNGFSVFAQQSIQGVTVTGSEGITVKADELQRISDAIPVKKRWKKPNEFEPYRRMLNHPGSPAISSYPNNGIRQNDIAATQATYSNFQAIVSTESGFTPPDCMGDVSETQVCIASNGRLKFFAKPTLCDPALITSATGGVNALGGAQFSVDLDVLFSSVRNGSTVTDPSVYYDRLSSRWFVVCINTIQQSNRILIAVSNSNVVNASSTFTFYYFEHDKGLASGSPDYHRFADYPMVGLDKNALYIGVLVFDATNSTYEGASIYVVKKSSLLSGGPVVFTGFRRIGSGSSGIYAPNPALNDDPQATKGYFVGVDAANYGVIDYIVVSDPGGNPTSATGVLNVPTTSSPINQPAKGSNKPLDAADDRLMAVQLMKNKITGEQSMWTSQNIAVPSSGVASSNATGLRNAVRWYELGVTSTAVTLKQSGTWYDNAVNNPMGYWMGSIGGNGQGHAIAGATAAGVNETPNVIMAGRYNTQTAGELANTVFITTAIATYNAETGEKQRWGDYSQTVVDPTDNMTMWTFQEYTNTTDNWAERAIQIKAPAPAKPTALSPITCTDTRTVSLTLAGETNNNFSGFFDPGDDTGGPGFKKRLQVTSTGSVVISNVKLLTATQISFTMNYAAAQLGSQQTLTITNPDCQAVTYAYTLPAVCDGPVTIKPISIFPNPAIGIIKIFLQNPGGQLRILDMTGRLMYSQTASSTYVQVPAQFARGVYIVQYINGNTKNSVKLMVM